MKMKKYLLLILTIFSLTSFAQTEIKKIKYKDQNLTIELPKNTTIETIYTDYNTDGNPRERAESFLAISIKGNKLSDIYIKDSDMSIDKIKEATENGFFKHNIKKVYSENEFEVIYEMEKDGVTYYKISGLILINNKKYFY